MISNGYVESVSSSIIRQLEMGTAPWVKPWQAGSSFMPFNPTTGNVYHGMNAVWLLSVMEEKGYEDNRWLTYNQANNLDAQVNRGEKGTLIQYWKWTDDVPVKDENGKPVKDDDGKVKKQTVRLQKPRVWSAVVFNANQIAGLPEQAERAVLQEWERHQQAEAILNDSGADVVYQRGDRAFYRPTNDIITLPERQQFPSMDGFYATALHELGHWTGHHSRLNRDLLNPLGSEGYAKEELRAEIASLMLGEQLSIGHDPSQHVSYVGTWIKVLQDDPREIFRAAADAERIAKYLIGQEMLQEKQQETVQTEQPVLTLAADTALRTDQKRVYLDVPFAEKNEAKALGAKWDRNEKSWYIPAGIVQEPFQQWTRKAHIEPQQTPEVEFTEALGSAGLVLTSLPTMDGKLHRVPVEGDNHAEKSGAYVGFLDGHPAGYIHNYKTGYAERWKSKQRQTALSDTDRVRLKAEAAEQQAERARAREEINEQTAATVSTLWLASEPAQTHPYLVNKGVQSHGLRINTIGSLELTGGQPDSKPQQWSNKGELLVPIHDINGQFLGAQSIDNNGMKSFPRGGRLHGGHHLLGQIESADKVLIAEGYATGATLHEVTGLPVVVAFHSGNLPAVAQAFREKYQDIVLVLAGDNDHSKPIARNVGLQKAHDAAALTGGHLLLPEFQKGDPGSDWNDVAQTNGLAHIKQQLTVALKVIDIKVSAAQQALKEQQEKEKQFKRQNEPEQELVQSSGRTLSM